MEEEKDKKNYQTSERRSEVDGKRFVVVRHFEGDKPLSAIILEIAIYIVDREMGI